MRGEKLLDGLGRGNLGSARSSRLQEFQKLRSIARWKAIGGVTHDVGVHVVSEIKADRQPARVCIRRTIGDCWKAG